MDALWESSQCGVRNDAEGRRVCVLGGGVLKCHA